MDRKREAFEKLAVIKALNLRFLRDPLNKDGYLDVRLDLAWQAYQQAYEDMYPVFDRIDELIKNDCQLYEPEFDTEWDSWLMMDGCVPLATGKTFRELCVNLIMSDGKDGEE